MAALIAAFDWSRTPLGPLAHWPDALTVPVAAMLRAPVPMAILWGETGVLIYNDGYAGFSGTRHPQLLGQDIRQAWPEAADFNASVLQTVLAGGTLVYQDQEFLLNRHATAEPVWISLNYSPLVDAAGRPAGVLALMVDTSASVRARRTLINERERFAALFDQSPSFMAMLEGPEHRITLANPNYLKLVGHRPLLGRTVAEALPDALAQGYVDLLDSVFATGESFSTYGSLYEMRVEAGGPVKTRYVDFVFQAIRDAAGAVSGIFVEGVDVTERMVNELRREGLAVFTNALRSLDSIEDISQAAAALLGQTLKVDRAGYGTVDAARETLTVARDWTLPGVPSQAGTLQLRDYGTFVDDLKRDEFVQVDDMRLDSRTAGAARALLASRGSLAFMLVPVTERGELVAVLFVIHTEARPWLPEDVAFMREVGGRTRTAVERARSQQALREANELLEARIQARTQELMEVEAKLRQSQKMEAIGQLTGGIAHDFNNLLGSMSASLQVLEKRVAAKKLDGLERYTGMAQDSLRRAASLTQRLLAFSRRQTLDPRPCDVNRLIGGIEDMVRRTVGPAVTVEVVGAGGLWLTRVDASQLENALLNLCINARDAMAPGGGRLTLETSNKWFDERTAAACEMSPGQYIAVCVTDTGAGMPPEVAERAFDPFFTTKPMGQGTGLGLSMVYGFVRQSGGQVRIYSEPGQGTTLCLYLPRFAGEAAPDEAPPEVFAQVRGDGEVVLLIEDETTIRQLVAEQLEDAGYTVMAVADGPSGLQLLQGDRRIDLLLTDVGLPGGLNGRQVADAARVTRAGLKVLFITGYAENAAVGNGLLAHGMEVITKPFDVGALVDKVRVMLDRPEPGLPS